MVLINLGSPIPEIKPEKTKRSGLYSNPAEKQKIEEELMLATYWPDFTDPSGWWMSEKFDGIRCFWNGKMLFSRNGRVIKAPKWFLEGLPSDVKLDGELW
jgi:DNA ligase-1